jgi:hypothetical protein
MKKTLGVLILLGMAAVPASAQKVTIDYAHDYDFKAVKTFEYVATKETDAPNELTDGRIKDAIIKQLVQGGLTQVDSDPNIYVTYHLTTKDDTVYNTTGYGYGGFGRGWRGWGMGMGATTTTETTYTEGTLVIDGYDAADKKMIWRGSGTVTVKSKPDKQAQQIDNIMTKLGEKWDKILAGMGE